MPDKAPLSFAFNLPFEEAIQAAQARGVLLPDAFYALPAEKRQYAQTISGMSKLDQIQAVQDKLTAYLQSGKTFNDFRREAGAMDFGLSPGKLDLVFRNAVQNAYNAGHWRNFEQHKARRPYLMYDAVNDSRTRPAHRAMDGIIKPVDDPFWLTHSPSCGHRCRCKLISLTADEITRRGGVTGEIPDGAVADKGWGYKPAGQGEKLDNLMEVRLSNASSSVRQAWNEGKLKRLNSSQLWDVRGNLDDCLSLMFEKLTSSDAPACLKATPTQKTWDEYPLPDLRELKKTHVSIAPVLLQAGKDETEALQILRAALNIPQDGSISVKTPLREIAIADWTLAHIVEKRADMRERYANFIIPTLEQPLEIWKTAYEDGVRERYIKLFEGRNDLFVVVRVNLDGSLLWNVMQRKTADMNNLRIGKILWKTY